jgi:hypothetical protein
MQDVLAQLGLAGYNQELDLSCIPCLSYSNKQPRTKNGFSVNGEPLNGQPVSLDFPAPDAGLTTHNLHLGTNLGFHILFSAIET